MSEGHIAWMLVATALVLLMTPALGFFYGGLVRAKNALNTLMMSFAALGFVGLGWALLGYSLAFTAGTPLIGDVSHALLRGVGLEAQGEIPQILFMAFQGTFAIITAALISGAIVERMRFGAYLAFLTLWGLLIYAPVAHWVWGGGWLADLGALDFAGGTVVHINAGVAGLICALVLGKRMGYGQENMAPHNLAFGVIGASMLWVGWFGFNAGSAVAAGGRAGMAILVTQIAAAAATLAWVFAEWLLRGKPSVLGAISGAVAGLVAITPASGFVLPGGALVIGVAAGLAGLWGATALKHWLGYDDSLDVFGVHGICGIVGALLTGLFAYGPLSATDASPEGTSGGLATFMVQLYAVAAVIVFTAIATYVLLKLTDAVVGLRVSEEEEREGLDVALHGERIA